MLSLFLAAAVFPYAFQQHDFPNGLRLITIPTDLPNVVAIQIVVQAGSRNEVEPGKTGFAHFFEHMMFRGTKQVPAKKFTATFTEAGASFNASTHEDFTNYYSTFSKADLETILTVEADRFQNLDYSLADFRTEALAVLGEYNKNFSNPFRKLDEVMKGLAYREHTYRHTGMGFEADIRDMPNQFDYSKEFFNRYYRPEYTTIIVVGDIQPQAVKAMVERKWGAWKRGNYVTPIPKEPPPDGARSKQLEWPAPTLPMLSIGYHVPAYSDTDKDVAALDLIQLLGFGPDSPIQRKLVLSEQKADFLVADVESHVDPSLFEIVSRIKKKEDLPYVQEEIVSTLAGFKDTLVSKEQLDRVRKRLKYSYAMSLNNSEAVARAAAYIVAITRTPASIDKMFDLYGQITPEDIRNTARKYFTEANRNTVTLTGAAK